MADGMLLLKLITICKMPWFFHLLHRMRILTSCVILYFSLAHAFRINGDTSNQPKTYSIELAEKSPSKNAGAYDPYQHRKVEHPISYGMTFFVCANFVRDRIEIAHWRLCACFFFFYTEMPTRWYIYWKAHWERVFWRCQWHFIMLATWSAQLARWYWAWLLCTVYICCCARTMNYASENV